MYPECGVSRAGAVVLLYPHREDDDRFLGQHTPLLPSSLAAWQSIMRSVPPFILPIGAVSDLL